MWQHVCEYKEKSVVFQFSFLRCDPKYHVPSFIAGVQSVSARKPPLSFDLLWLRCNDLKKILMTQK